METVRLLDALAAAGLDPTPIEIAEAIWLSRHISSVAAPSEESPDSMAVNSDRTASSPVPRGDAGMRPDPEEDYAGAEEPGCERPIRVASTRTESTGTTDALVVRVPEPAALPSALALHRALRPLKRRYPAPHGVVVNEEASAHRVAETGIWSLVLERAPERWFDVALVVDSAVSMTVWEPAVRDLHRALRQFGGFRDVRRWKLVDGQTVGIQAHDATDSPDTRPPSELLDPAGRRVFVVVTDASASMWRGIAADEMLSRWAHNGPLLVVQPLPERLWHRTALPTRRGTFHALTPGAPTSRLHFAERRRRTRHDTGTNVAVPVVELSADWLATWASMVMASTASGVPLVAARLGPRPSSRPIEEPTIEAEVVVRRFRATASPSAFRLATYLSAAPVDLDVMRLVQRIFLPSSGPSDLAEVLLGGLLERLPQVAAHPAPHFAFRPGVQDLLLDDLRISESRDILRVVGAFIAERSGRPGRTFAGVTDSAGVGSEMAAAEVFAWLTDEAAARLGVPGRVSMIPAPSPKSARSPRRRALLMGAETFGLASTNQSMALIADALAAHGFGTISRTSDRATRAEIFDALDQLVNDTVPGDAVFVYFNGRGGRMISGVGQSARLVHFIVPADFEASDLDGITDDELNTILIRLSELTTNVTVVFDCSHAPHRSQDSDRQVLALPGLSSPAPAGGDDSGFPGAGLPHVVRLSATGPDQPAYEYRNAAGRRVSLFSEALATALIEAQGLPVSWATVIERVRTHVMTVAPLQHPQAEGPTRRQIFKATEVEPHVVLPVVVVSGERVELPGGPLFGVQVGDSFAIMAAEETTVIGEALVFALGPTVALATVQLRPPWTSVPAGALAHRTRAALAAVTVSVPHPDPRTDDLVAAIEQSRLIRLAEPGEVFDLRVSVDDADQLVVHDQVGPLHEPHQPTQSEIRRIITDMETVARAKVLRGLSEIPPSGSRTPVTLEWGRVTKGERERLASSGALVHAGEKIYISARNLGDEPVYLSLIDIGVLSKITVVTSSEYSGIRLAPGAEYIFGRRGSSLIGAELTWPDRLPRKRPRSETLLALITAAPHNVGYLQQGGVRDAHPRPGSPLERIFSQVGSGGSRDATPEVFERPDQYDIRAIDFTLSPQPPTVFAGTAQPIMTPNAIRTLCVQIRSRSAVAGPPNDSPEVDDQLVDRIMSDVAEYRRRFPTTQAPVPPDELLSLLPLMGWLIYEASLDQLWNVPAQFEEPRADVDRIRRLANAARGLIWPEYAPRALGAIRVEALTESKRDSADGYDKAWSLHQEAAEMYRAFKDSLAGVQNGDRFLLALDEVFLQLALAETGSACRAAERVLGRWFEEFQQSEAEAERRESERWTQRLFYQLTAGIASGELALGKALAIKTEAGFVNRVTEDRMTLPTALRNPAIMTCRAILLAYSLCPEMERLRRVPPDGSASWAGFQAVLLARFDRAFALLLEPVQKADGTDWPMNADHRRTLVQICLHLGLVAPGYRLAQTVAVDESLTLRTVNDDTVERLSAWLATRFDGKTRGDANVIGSASKPDFIRSVEACRQNPEGTASYRAWRLRWPVLDRYAFSGESRANLFRVLGPTDTL